MEERNEKIIAIALVMVLAISMLAACGGNNTPSGGGNTSKPSSSSTPSGNSSNNSTPGGNSSTSPPATSSAPSGNGGDNSTSEGKDNSGGEAIGYPSYWNDDIPKINGTVTFDSNKVANTVEVWVEVKNDDVVLAYIDSLKSKGYDLYNDNEDKIIRLFALKNDKWDISISYDFEDMRAALSYTPLG